jgi:hypothetical protein
MKLLIVALSVVLVLSLFFETEAHDRVTTAITWNREISRITFERCASCHREGGMAFSLTTYAEARPWAVAIKEDVLARRMPPWGGVKGFGEFRNDQALTAEQIEMITDWVDGGMPEGNPTELPPLPQVSNPFEDVEPSGGLPVSGDFTLKQGFTLDGIWPQKVPENASFQIFADLPDGRVEPLLWLYEYKNQYAHSFLFRTPVELPVGSVIRGVPDDSVVVLLPAASLEHPK